MTDQPLSQLEAEILGLAVEDFYSLHELRARAAAAVGSENATDSARHALRSLLARGLVDLYQRHWIDDPPRRIDEPSAGLLGEGAWDEPDGASPTLLIGATNKGERAYFGRADE